MCCSRSVAWKKRSAAVADSTHTRPPSRRHRACSTHEPLRKKLISQARRRRSRPRTWHERRDARQRGWTFLAPWLPANCALRFDAATASRSSCSARAARCSCRASERSISRTSVRRCTRAAARATLSTSRAIVEAMRRSGRTLPPRFAARGPAVPAAPHCIATRGASTAQPPAPALKLPPKRTPSTHPRLNRSSLASSSAANEAS